MAYFFRSLLIVGVIGWLALPAFGEYYQYTDQSGVLRFTDNLANVPKDQRPDVKTYKSVKADAVNAADGLNKETETAPAPAAAEKDAPPVDGSWDERVSRQGDELDRRQVELNKLFTKLQNERTALEAKAPPTGASSKTTRAYRKRVEALNARIERYEKQRVEFEKKVTAFNAKFKK